MVLLPILFLAAVESPAAIREEYHAELKAMRALAVSDQTIESDSRPSWDLFSDRAALETRMTHEIRQNVALSHGIAIKG